MSKTVTVGAWKLDSGNVCRATLSRQIPTSVTIDFAWDSSPADADRDQFQCIVLPKALDFAKQYADEMAGIFEAMLALEAQGRIERQGITDAGQTLWRGVTENA